jgi:very-short-patch-repair endonuclease
MYAHAVDRAAERLARRQHGVFAVFQLQDSGLTKDVVRRRVACGAWVRIAPGVYALTSHPATWTRQCMAAHLDVPGSAVAGLAAAHLHTFTDFVAVRAELMVPPGRANRSRLATVHRFDGALTGYVRGIPVTTIAQTVADVAGRVPLQRIERAVDDLVAAGRLAVPDLAERAEFYRGVRRRGAGVLAMLAAERSEDGWVPTESELEAKLDRVLSRLQSRPRVVRQHGLPWRPAARQRVDRLLPDWRTIVEADGRRWHIRVADFDRDRWRDNEAQAHGYRILRFTHLHLTAGVTETIALIEATGRLAA